MSVQEIIFRGLLCIICEGAFLSVVFTLINPEKRAKIRKKMTEIHVNLSKNFQNFE